MPHAGALPTPTYLDLMHPDGSHLRQLTHAPSGTVDSSPAYSPNGRRIAFARSYHDGAVHLLTMNRHGNDVHRVESPAFGETLGVSAWGARPR